MRVFKDFLEAKNEIRRDLNELGRTVFSGYQSLEVSEAEFTTKELENYDYRVLRPAFEHLEPQTIDWVKAEWAERLAGIEGRPSNPGEAWKLRPEVWKPLLEKEGYFSYTYSNRLHESRVPRIIEAMRKNRNTRQAYVAIWNPLMDSRLLGQRRVPCTLGYQMLVRDGRLDVTYHMRSSDFSTHFDNDIWLAMRLQLHFAIALGLPLGTFTHCITSLHVYAADVAGVF